MVIGRSDRKEQRHRKIRAMLLRGERMAHFQFHGHMPHLDLNPPKASNHQLVLPP